MAEFAMHAPSEASWHRDACLRWEGFSGDGLQPFKQINYFYVKGFC